MSIIFYDLPSTVPGNAWSPNTWKTRYTLNYKGIPYTTEWVEYPDVEELSKRLGFKPTSKKADGRDHYTLPAIHDPSTGVYISDSVLIAEYLEKQYPDTPSLFPHNTIALQHAFAAAYASILEPLWEFILPATCFVLNPRSKEYFRRTREATFKKTMEDVIPKGEYGMAQWNKLQGNFERLDGWYAKTDAAGPFLLGKELTWGDVVVVSFIVWLRIIWGKDSQQWKNISGWHGGRWGKLVEEFDKYAAIH